MSDIKDYPKGNSRQIMDYNRFLSLTGTKIFLCLDRGVMEIAKYLLNSRGGWRTSYAKEWLEYSYIMPSEEEFLVVKNAIAEANLDMASCDDIVEALQGIQGAIANSSSGGGCGCIASGDDDIGSVNDRQSEPIPPTSDWEELGFASQEAYATHKCEAAQYIIVNYIATLRNWAGLFGMVGGLTIAVVAGLLLLTVPPAGLILIVGALSTLVSTDIGLLVNLSLIADCLESQIDDIRCDLYNATTTSEATGVIQSYADDCVFSLDLGLLENTFETIVNNLISNLAVSALFDPAGPATSEGSPDCSGCEPPIVGYFFLEGSGTETSSHPSNPFTATGGVWPGGTLGCSPNEKSIFVGFSEPVHMLSVTSTETLNSCSGEAKYKYYEDNEWQVFLSETNSAPQDAPAGCVMGFAVVWDSTGIDPVLTFEYELCPD